MQSLDTLLNLSENFYTPMGIDKELFLIEEIQKYDIDYIQLNLKSFYSLLQLLYDSHGDDYIFVDKSNETYFINFIDWLRNLKKESFINKDFIESLEDTFSVNTSIGS